VEVYADLVEDLSRSLAQLHDVLSVKVSKEEPLYASLVQDAQIFSFVRTSQVLRLLMQSIRAEDDEEFYKSDIESVIFSLCLNEVITEEQAEKLLHQLDIEEFFLLDGTWLDSEQDRRTFEGGINELTSFFQTMNRFLDTVSREFMLREREETSHECH
jgi:hypothetical protein